MRQELLQQLESLSQNCKHGHAHALRAIRHHGSPPLSYSRPHIQPATGVVLAATVLDKLLYPVALASRCPDRAWLPKVALRLAPAQTLSKCILHFDFERSLDHLLAQHCLRTTVQQWQLCKLYL